MNWIPFQEVPDALTAPWPERGRYVAFWHKACYPLIGYYTSDGVFKVDNRPTHARFIAAIFSHWAYVDGPTT